MTKDPSIPKSIKNLRERELDYEVTLGNGGVRLDLFLQNLMEWRSRSSIQKLIELGKVRRKVVAGKGEAGSSDKPSRKVKEGEIYSVTIPKPRRELEPLLSNEKLEMPVIYEDRWILVIDKPAGIPVHPSGRILDRTVITHLNKKRKEQLGEDALPLKLCHRLDLETSGILLIGKDPITQPRFVQQFENRAVVKEYLALVHGVIDEDQGEINLPIGVASGSAIYMKRGINVKKGQPARTGFQVEKRMDRFSLVRLRLYTGRHHQLRVHLSSINHPIVGDKVYGHDETLFIKYHENRLDSIDRERLILPRQALHAARLIINHPPLNKEISFEAPLPDDMVEFMNSML